MRTTKKKKIVLSAGTALALAFTASVSAQGGFAAGFAPTDAMDTLSGGSVGPSGAGYVDRARNVASDPFATGGFAPQPAAPAGADPFAAGGFAAPPAAAPGFDPAMAFDPALGAAGGVAPFPAQPGFGAPLPGQAGYVPEIPKVTAIYGDRVVCNVTGQMLQDAYEVPIYQTFIGDYYDDGQTAMDYQAGDNKYTNVRLVEDAMSAEAHLVKTRLIQGLRYLENLKPNEFAVVPVASTDPLASVPNMLELEAERDEKLLIWARRFLRDYRVNPEEEDTGTWDFHETYMPAPPFPPFSNIPSTFYPPNAVPAGGAEGNQEAGAAGANPGANSQYLDPAAAGAFGGK